MVLACIIAGWSVSQLSSWLFLHSPVEHAAPYYIMNHFSRVSLNIYLIYLKQPRSVLRLLLCTNRFDGITCNLSLLMGFREKRTKATTSVWSKMRSLKASGILTLQPAAGRCYCKQCSRKELSSPQYEQVFCWSWSRPSSPAPQGSERSRAGTTLDVTRSLCKRHLDSPAGSSSRNLQSTEKAKVKILSAAMATQKYWGSRCSESKEEVFSPNQGKVLPLTLKRLHSSLHFKISIAKKPKRNKRNPRFCLFLQDHTMSPFEEREHGVKFA